jgi:chromosome partitioning protein
MSHIIGFISQKGGVGKSTLARLVAREYASGGWNVKIADLDPAVLNANENCFQKGR